MKTGTLAGLLAGTILLLAGIVQALELDDKDAAQYRECMAIGYAFLRIKDPDYCLRTTLAPAAREAATVEMRKGMADGAWRNRSKCESDAFGDIGMDEHDLAVARQCADIAIVHRLYREWLEKRIEKLEAQR